MHFPLAIKFFQNILSNFWNYSKISLPFRKYPAGPPRATSCHLSMAWATSYFFKPSKFCCSYFWTLEQHSIIFQISQPYQMREFRVTGAADDSTIQLLEFFCVVIKWYQFGRAHKPAILGNTNNSPKKVAASSLSVKFIIIIFINLQWRGKWEFFQFTI